MNREEALDVALGQIERQFGKGSVMRMSDQAQVSVGAVSTGSLSLDLALGIGGLPRGRVVEVFGPESSGKTTLVYHVIAEAQRRGGICAFIDAEHAMDPQYAKRIGVDIDNLLVSQPDTGEQALEICELLIRSGALDVVAIDSVAALTPKAEIEGEMGDSHVGLQARLMSQALRKLAGTLNRTDTICLFTNQLREKIGVMFGKPETTPGRPRAEVLRVGPARHPADRDAQGRRRGVRQPRARQGRQEQGRAAVQAGGVRHHLRHRHLLGGHGARRRASSGRSSRRPAPTSASATSGSARVARTRRRSWASTPTSSSRSSRRSRPRPRRSRSSRPGFCRRRRVLRRRRDAHRGRGGVERVQVEADPDSARSPRARGPTTTEPRRHRASARGRDRRRHRSRRPSWRVVPPEAVVAAGLSVGGAVDRDGRARSGASCGGSRRAGRAPRSPSA